MNPTAARRPLLMVLVIGLVALAGHWLQVLLFSHSLPFADQWDSEAALIFKPWMEGGFNAQMLLFPHNEHRIVWKHLFDLALFELNGRYWDNRVIALANCVIYAAALMLLGKASLQVTEPRTRRLLVGLCLLLPFTTFAYENTLWGFQSPFPMLLACGLLCLQWASAERFGIGNALAVLGCVVAALFTLASGFLLAPVAAALLLAARCEAGPQRRLQYLSAAMIFGVGIGGYLAMPHLDHHAALRAHSVSDFIAASMLLLSWPVPSLPLLWLPLLFWALFSVVYREVASRSDRFFGGLAVWTGLQAAALAFGRGHEMTVVASRYVDMLIFGLVANTYFLGRLFWHTRLELRPRLPLRLLLSGCAFVVAGFSVLQLARSTMVSHHKQALWQANHEVAAAMLSGADVSEDNFALPYPSKARMTDLLRDPTIQKMLGVADGYLPADCSAPRNAWLSRLACVLAGGGAPPLPIFSMDSAAPASEGTLLCALDMLGGTSLDDSVTADPSLPLRFAGWAGPGARYMRGVHYPLQLRLVSTQTTLSAPVIWRHPRPDVAAVMNDPHMAWSGFDIALSSRGLLPGSYRVELTQDGRRCDTQQVLVVR